MRRPLTLLAVAATALVAGCGGGGDDSASTTGESVELTQKKDLTIAVITHGEGDSFWAVVKRGAEQGAKDAGVTLRYSESQNDPQKQAQLIESSVTEKVDGIAVSAPDPDALAGAIGRATDAGIPVVTLNSGADQYKELGALTHFGQSEEIAGRAGGERLKQAGGKKLLCIIHEQANVGLNQRCDGAKAGFGETENLQVKGVSDVSTTLTEIQSKLQSDKSIDSVLALNPDIAVAARDAVKGAGSQVKVATFDLSGDVVKAIEAGEIGFAIDQQQYLQGYLPVIALTLYKTNANTIGGGQPVLTGPGFVDEQNASTVAKLAEEGTR